MNPHRIVVGALLVAAVALPSLPATANENDVVKRGDCTGHTTWKLKASEEAGRIEVESEVDSNHNGQVWRWRLAHNGSVSARGEKTTRAPSGSFEVRRVVVDLRGTDKLVFRAENTRSGEICRGVVHY